MRTNRGERALGKNRQMGFTLVEHLIVVAILAVLAAVITPPYTRFFSSGEAEANAAELTNLQTVMDAMMAGNRINAINPQSVPTNDFSALPEGDGTEFLSPAFLRSSKTKCTYTWEADGLLIQTGCGRGASTASP